MRRTLVSLTAFATGLVLADYGTSSTPAASSCPSASAPSSPTLSGTVNVFAASSLQEAFTTLGKHFEAAHPGTKVVFNFGISSGLATQINAGAPADVFASASTKNIDTVVKAEAATFPTNFARNVMEITSLRRTRPGSPSYPTWPSLR